MVDALRGVFGVKRIPMTGFVSVNDGGRGDDAFHERQPFGFGLCDGRNGPAATLASDDHDAALLALVLGKAAVDAIFLEIGGADMTAEIATINLNRTRKRRALDLRGDGFAELVSENESRLVLAIEIAGELKHGNALDRVRQDDDGGKEVNEGHLATVEDRAARYGKLVAARLALELAARRDRVSLYAAAAGANRLAIGISPAKLAEGLIRLLIAALINRAKGKGPSRC